MMTRRTVVLSAMACATVVTACAAPAKQNEGATAMQNHLRADVSAVASAIAANNRSAAEAAMLTLRTDGAAALATGTLSADKLQAIRDALDRVQADLDAGGSAAGVSPTRSVSVTRSASPTPTPTPVVKPAPAPPHGGKKGKGGH